MTIWNLGVLLAGLALLPATATVAPTTDKNGIVSIPSNHSVDETVDKLKNLLEAKGITLFVVIDHSGEAAKVGMKMPNTKLLMFGNPKGATPLMLAAPSIAIDLPLKILVAEDSQRKVLGGPLAFPGPFLSSMAAMIFPQRASSWWRCMILNRCEKETSAHEPG